MAVVNILFILYLPGSIIVAKHNPVSAGREKCDWLPVGDDHEKKKKKGRKSRQHLLGEAVLSK